MKKLLALITFVGLFAAAKPLFAGTALDQAGQNNQGPYTNTSIFTSSNPTSGGAATITLTTTTKNSSGQTINCRNCLTRIILQMSVGTTFYLIDGAATVGTTNYVVYGAGLGASGTNTLNIVEDHLGPLCSSGPNMTLTMPAPSVNTVNNVINIEGYTYCGYANNSGL